MPSAARRGFSAGSASTSRSTPASFAVISLGVPLGTHKAVHVEK
jgi:hypothetical protein